jgi:hypothetical protein
MELSGWEKFTVDTIRDIMELVITIGLVYVLSTAMDFTKKNTKRIDKIEQILKITPEKD